jgi:hypothetical protein
LPDFRGNGAFNTIGNLLVRPQAGLLFIDFASGDLVSLATRASVLWDGPEIERFAGAERLLRCEIEDGVRLAQALPFGWSAAEPARQLAATGAWR